MRVSGLVFAGGLLKAVTLLGALKSFEEATGGLPDLRVLAGSSSGAILAAMVATGWKADEISDYLINDLKIVGDLLRHNPLQVGWRRRRQAYRTLAYAIQLNKLSLLWKLIRGRGLDDGTLLHETLGKMLARHANPDITFAEVAAQFGHDLVVTGSCYTGCEGLVFFSNRTTPNMPVRTALRASAGQSAPSPTRRD
jgi:predicted acylesterase/phospholipase RssA